MQDFLSRISNFSPKRLALLADELNSRLEAAEASKAEPIAIVGIGCRFPGGVTTPEAYWELIRRGDDAITEVPADRWDVEAFYDSNPDAPGKMSTRWGGFVDNVDRFDPHFFGISPREAQSMDPQQRLLLEVTWEALEHAGISPDRITGTKAAVFVGISATDYHQLIRDSGLRGFDAYTASGVAHSIASGRLSYVLGLQGPSISVDTACSSSLVAIHQAVQSLRAGECAVALAGGVNLILGPEVTIALSKSHMMAPDGRCKVFDARADGFVRGEGCGIVVLKRLADATADGDRIIAVIRGSASNQDGRSNGLTAPNGPSQEAVIRDALANARLSPAAVDYVEAHGTGTSLGDPIEVRALGAAYGSGRAPEAPLLVGSVKANIGHLEAAAGVAALIKAALALHHGEIPPQRDLREPNPFIPWDELPVRVPTALAPWPVRTTGLRVAGVSSFGFSGTNVHVLLESAPATTARTTDVAARPLHVVALSARHDASLADLAARYERHFTTSRDHVADVAHTANAGRAHFNNRLAIVAASAEDAAVRLAGFAAGQRSARIATGLVKTTRAPKIALLFTGQGAQYAGMGRALYETNAVFRETLDRCQELLSPHLDRPLLSVLFPTPSELTPGTPAAIDDTRYTQPALFALEYALATLWSSWGIRPAIVMGHSIGEYVAACVAGVFSLEDALRLIAARGRLMSALPRDGGMAAIFADEARVAAALAPWPRDLSIAAVNGPTNVVISGRASSLQSVIARLTVEGVESIRLNVSHAFHSPLVEPMLEEFRAVARSITYAPPRIDLISDVTGTKIGARAATADYWVEHVRSTVQFAPAMRSLADASCDVYLEAGPHPTLLTMGQSCVAKSNAAWIPSLRKGKDDWEQLLESVAALYTRGVEIDWAAFDAGYARRTVTLPRYPFRRERHWIEQPAAASRSVARERLHVLLGWEVRQAATADRIFETEISVELFPYLEDHRIFGSLLLPSPALMEIARAAGTELFGDATPVISDLSVHRALPFSEGQPLTIQLVAAPPRDGVAEFRIVGLDTDGSWQSLATGRLATAPAQRAVLDATSDASRRAALNAIRARVAEPVDVTEYYRRLEALGLTFGPRFRGVAQITRRDGEALGRMELPDALARDAESYGLHPALLDACFHVIGAALPGAGAALNDAFLLMHVERIRLHRRPTRAFWNHVVVRGEGRIDVATQETFTADLRLLDDDGTLIAEFEGLHLKRVAAETVLRSGLPARVAGMLYDVEWREAPRTDGGLPAPRHIADAIVPQVAELAVQHRLDVQGDFLQRLDRLVAAYAAQALQTLGADFAIGSAMAAGALIDRLNIAPRHRRLVARLLEILGEDGVLEATGSGEWRVVSPPPAIDVQREGAVLAAEFPDGEAELDLTRQCGQELASVLRGTVDPLQILFPGGSLAGTERLYERSPIARAYNGLIAEAFERIAGAAPTDRPLRVLEIGAGTGSTTTYVLSKLGRGPVEYTFTDVSPLFLNRARDKFRDAPFMRYALLDIGRSPATQGFVPGTFDVIVGANVLHATPDLEQTMKHVHELLTPGGLVVLLEATTPQRFGDVTVGLLDGWWAYTDTSRRDYALMPRDRWLTLLAETGFAGGVAVPGENAGPVLSQQAVFVAQRPATDANRTAARWLIVPDASGLGQAVAAELEQQGDVAVLLPMPQRELSIALRDAMRTTPPYAGVIALHALDVRLDDATTTETVAVDQKILIGGALDIVQTLARSDAAEPPRLWFVTRGAQATHRLERANPAQATLWGMSHVVAMEHPELHCVRLDLDAAGALANDARAIAAELHGVSLEDQIALRGEARLARRLARQTSGVGTHAAVPTRLRSDATYFITGGLRGLGLRVAEWLADQGARHIALMGRRAPSRDAQAVVDRLTERGLTVHVASGDVSVRADVERVLSEIERTMPPLRGVIHAAGVLDDGVLSAQTRERFATVMAPKVLGTWHLHSLTGALDFLVLFSSGASLAGSPGQANHAAANAFEDALAFYRQSQGQPTVSINWGPWAEIGAAADRGIKTADFVDAIAPRDGLMALEWAMRRTADGGLFGHPQVGVLATDWPRLLAQYQAGRVPVFFSDFANIAKRQTTETSAADDGRAAEPSLLDRLQSAAPNRRRTILLSDVRRHTVKVLGLAESDPLDVTEPLRQLGLDSLMAVELRNLLGRAVGRTLPATLTFDHPTVDALVEHLAKDVFAEQMSATVEPVITSEAPVIRPSTDSIDDLSETELAQRLLRKLEKMS